MPAKFNLLPKDSAVNKDIARITKTLKVLSMVVVVIASLGGMAGASALYYYTNLLNKEKDRHQTLKTTVNSLENAEQSLVLIKDRTQKLGEILNSRQNINTFLKHKSVTDNLPANISLLGSSIFPTDARLDLISTSSRSMVDLFNDLKENEELNNVTIRQISFNPSQGFTVSLSLN